MSPTPRSRLGSSGEAHARVLLERRGYVQYAFDALLGVVDEVLPIGRETVDLAKQLVLQYPTLPVRAAMHVATMQQHRIDTLMSFDPGFDRVPGLNRLR